MYKKRLLNFFVGGSFLLSPFLYEKKSLGSISWTADYNPLYQVVNSVRETIITGELSLVNLTYKLKKVNFLI